MDATSFQSVQRRFDEHVINANRGDLDLSSSTPSLLDQFLLQRMATLGAQSANALVGVVSGKRGQIHARDGAQKPCGLPFFFYGPSGNL